jgi:hypothetical protein
MSLDQHKNNLVELSLSNKTILNLPSWQKQLWIELIQRNAKESWPYETIIKEYTILRDDYCKLQEQYEKIKDSGTKNVKLGENVLSLQSEIIALKCDNESLKRENIEKHILYEKIKEENSNLLNSILKAKEIEALLQNKILDLEIQIQKFNK